MAKSILTKKQEEMANHVLDGTVVPNATTVAKIPKVAEYIAGQRAELSSALQISRADVIDGLVDAINMARLAADPMAMIRGWSEVGKMLGHYAPEVKKIDLRVNGNMVSKYEIMTDAELEAIAEGRTIDGEVITSRTTQ